MKKKIMVGALLTIIIISTFIFTSIILKQKDKINSLEESYNKLKLNYDTLKISLESEKKENIVLKDENQVLSKKSNSLNQEMKEVQEEIGDTMDKLDNFENQVRDSMDWFKKNNNLNNSEIFKELREDLKDKCLENKSQNSVCEIDFDCIDHVNDKNFIIYKSDRKLVNKTDFLQDIESIYKNHGGDCEDFSFLFTAEYNYLLGECLKQGFSIENVSIVTLEDGDYEGGYMYPVCGFFGPHKRFGGNIIGGHCVVGIVRHPIKKTKDIYENLKDAVLFEPQAGDFLLRMDDTETIYLFDTGEFPDKAFRVKTVITEEDLKIFYQWSEEIEWLGYQDFLKDAELLRQKIEG